MYNTFIINRNYIFIINNFKVLILLYLYKGNFNIININNSFIKLEVINDNETFTFFN